MRADSRKKTGTKGRAHTAADLLSGKRHVLPGISLEAIVSGFTRADLEFEGVDHSGASFEARIFIDRKDADKNTPKTEQEGYVGSFHIFGHGGCFGDVGHCELRGLPRPYDPRPAHPLTPARKVVIATDAIRRALQSSKKTITVTVVPVVTGGTQLCDFEQVLKFDRMFLITYL